MEDVKVLEAEEALDQTPATSKPEVAEPQKPVSRYVKTHLAGVSTTLPSGKVIEWKRKKLPSGRITNWGVFETDDPAVVKELDAVCGVDHIHKT